MPPIDLSTKHMHFSLLVSLAVVHNPHHELFPSKKNPMKKILRFKGLFGCCCCFQILMLQMFSAELPVIGSESYSHKHTKKKKSIARKLKCLAFKWTHFVVQFCKIKIVLYDRKASRKPIFHLQRSLCGWTMCWNIKRCSWGAKISEENAPENMSSILQWKDAHST